MRKKLLAVKIAGLISVGVSVPVLAQDGFILEEIIVTAQKREESSQDIPVSVQAFGAESIERLGATQVNDLSRSAPSLSIGGLGGSNAVSGIRGVVDFSRNVGVDARMGVYIDGVYQGRSSSANQPLLGLQSVEILRGPQGTLFGKNTVSGAINLNTRKPSEEYSGEFSVGLGNEGYKTASVYLNGPLSDSVSGSVALSRQERDGYFNNTTTGSDVGDWEQEGFRGQLLIEASDSLDVILAADYGKTDSDIPLYTLESSPAYDVGSDKERDVVEYWGGSATLNFTTDNDYLLTSITAYRGSEYELEADEDFSPVDVLKTFFDEESDQFSQEFRITSPDGGDYDWVAGVYYFDSEISTGRNLQFGTPFVQGALLQQAAAGDAGTAALITGTLLPNANALSGNLAIPSTVDVKTYAAYFHGNYRFSDQWELTAGLRYTYEEKEIDWSQRNTPDDPVIAAALGFPEAPGALTSSGNAEFSDDLDEEDLSPTIGINFTPQDNILAYAKYSRAFKSGGWNADFRANVDLGFDSISYDSESVDSYEIGLKSDLLEGALRLNVTGFWQEFSDYQILQRFPVGTVELTNAGEATSKGVELETVWLPVDTLQLTLNVTYLDATYDKYDNPVAAIDPAQPENFEGNSLSYASDWKGYAGIQYIQRVGDYGELIWNLDYSYQSESYVDPQNREIDRIPSYDLWNLRVGYTPSSEKWELSAYVSNLEDDDHITARSADPLLGTDRVQLGSPRFFGAKFKYFLGY